jgi:hypothetical protein
MLVIRRQQELLHIIFLVVRPNLYHSLEMAMFKKRIIEHLPFYCKLAGRPGVARVLCNSLNCKEN